MENLTIEFDDGTGAVFDAALKDSLREGGDLRAITKERATQEGRPLVMLTFTVEAPDGSIRRAQSVTTARLLIALGRALAGRYGED